MKQNKVLPRRIKISYLNLIITLHFFIPGNDNIVFAKPDALDLPTIQGSGFIY